jgi:ATP-dependent Clp protease ATP-binding subunit ClpA
MILSKNFQDIIYQSIIFAVTQMNHQYLTPEHLLFCALEDKSVVDMMNNQMVDLKQLKNKLFHFLQHDLSDLSNKNANDNNVNNSRVALKFTNHLVVLLERAIIHSCDSSRDLISINDFLLEMMMDYDSHGGYFLRNANMFPMELVRYNNYMRDIDDIKNFNNIGAGMMGGIYTGNQFSNINPSMGGGIGGSKKGVSNDKSYDFLTGESFDRVQGGQSSSKDKKNGVLEQFCINFNTKAIQNKIDHVFSREKELDMIIKSLCCRRKGNCLLVGDSGVGKTAIIEYLAQKIVDEDKDVPQKFKNAIVYSLDLNSLISGTRYRGDLEERLKNIMVEIENSKIPIILFVDEIHTVIGTGSTNNGTFDIGNILKPYLARGVIYCIGATTRKEFSQYLSKDKAFLRRFQLIYINEPNEADARKMIKGIIKNYENYHKVLYSENAINAAVRLSKRYILERQLPDVALDVIDFAGSIVALNRESGNGKTSVINTRDIENVIVSLANLPNKRICENEVKRILSLESDLKLKIIGQDDAIKKVCSSILVHKAGLHHENSNKPMASYIFYGSTGVGKTELAIQLSKLMNMNLLRIDMSEYSEAHSVSKLFGSPPGYVGFDQSGLLSEEIIKNPYTVILFDEIEKSHHMIHNSLLQILDYGFITDSFGRKVNFSNTIIICTTNTASNSMDKITPGFGNQGNDEIIERELENMFSPEFRNRFSAIIRFNHLDKVVVERIIERELGFINKLFRKKNISFEVSSDVKNLIIEKSYNRSMGARPIDRVINDQIKVKLADVFLSTGLMSEANENDDYFIELHNCGDVIQDDSCKDLKKDSKDSSKEKDVSTKIKSKGRKKKDESSVVIKVGVKNGEIVVG